MWTERFANLRFIVLLPKWLNLSPVADPGFPVGGPPTRWGGANLQRVHFSAKTYVKMKEIDPVGGACAGGAPLDLPMPD